MGETGQLARGLARHWAQGAGHASGMMRTGAARTCGQRLPGRRTRTVGWSRTTCTGLPPRGGGSCGAWPRGGGAGQGRLAGGGGLGQHQQAAGSGRRGGSRRQR